MQLQFFFFFFLKKQKFASETDEKFSLNLPVRAIFSRAMACERRARDSSRRKMRGDCKVVLQNP